MGLGTMRKGRHTDPVAADKRVVAAKFCIKCGGDLRGLSIEDRCPTCRHPIYDSVYGGYLIDASPKEPRRLHEMSNVVYYPALFLGGLAAIMILAELASARSFADAVVRVFDVGLFCAMLSLLVALVGIAVFTGRHSAEYYRARYVNLRFLVPAAVLFVLGATALGLILYYGGYYAQAVVQVAVAACPAAVFLQRLSNLMRRVPNKKLATFANLALALTCALAAAALAFLALDHFAPPGSDLFGFKIALAFIADLGGIGLGMATLRLLFLARRTLRAICH
jgi:hypothetical protein